MDLSFCKHLPKLELHAHLNGSLSKETLLKLGCLNESIREYQSLVTILEKSERTLNDCFELFKVAHNITNNVDNLYLTTRDVIKEFYDDGVIYLELRSTPRCANDMSKKQYIEIIVRAIKDDCNNIIVKLILSIDRRHGVKESEQALDLIIEMKNNYPDVIVGIDLSGNPNIGTFDESLFARARHNHLKVTLHCGEVKNEEETLRMLQFKPDRIGHGTCLHPNANGSEELWQCYLESPIPIEACLSSNVICGTTLNYDFHHVKHWHNNALPFSLGTDDKGVFSTTLSNEYLRFAKTFDCNKEQLYRVSRNILQQIFASDEEKMKLTRVFDEFYETQIVKS